MLRLYLSLFFLSFVFFGRSDGHGYPLIPAGRSTLWRHADQFPNAPINYDDNGLNCGGFGNQWTGNNGKCGICGDPYEQSKPRDNEDGGKYGQGIIAETYKAGQHMNITIVVTVNHHGFFEFRICNDTELLAVAPQKCLNRTLLELSDGSGTRFFIPEGSPSAFSVNIGLKLPEYIVCKRCVLQWHWNTASNWGICPSGEGQLGCGPQETFRGCADIAIVQ